MHIFQQESLSLHGKPENNWAASSEFGTYRLCEQRRFRRACTSAQSHQNLRYSLIQAVTLKEPSDKARSMAPLNGWTCAIKICHDGKLEDTNSLDGAQLVLLPQVMTGTHIFSKQNFLLLRPSWISQSPSITPVHACIFRYYRPCRIVWYKTLLAKRKDLIL